MLNSSVNNLEILTRFNLCSSQPCMKHQLRLKLIEVFVANLITLIEYQKL